MHKICTSQTSLVVFLGVFLWLQMNENPHSLFPRSNYTLALFDFGVRQDVGSAASVKIVDVFWSFYLNTPYTAAHRVPS